MRSASFLAGIGRAALLIAGIAAIAAPANAQALKPFKDDLFVYPAILGSDGGESYLIVDYRKDRDIHQRDEVPERRVRSHYISTSVRRAQKDVALETEAGTVPHFAVGKTDGAAFIAIYLHGQGGTRRQGVDDYTFGGNFNRIKNLMVANGGLYLSPDFSDFEQRGAAE